MALDATPISLLNNIWTMEHLNMSLRNSRCYSDRLNKGKRDLLNGSDLTHYQHDSCNAMYALSFSLPKRTFKQHFTMSIQMVRQLSLLSAVKGISRRSWLQNWLLVAQAILVKKQTIQNRAPQEGESS